MAAKAASTTLAVALKQWEEKEKLVAADATDIRLRAVLPSINKLDNALASLPKLQFLSLSSNTIEKMNSFQGLSSLRVLALGRNNIKKIEGLEAVADTLEELWLSYNLIEKVNGVECCKKLKVFYLSQNKVKDWASLDKIKDLPILEDLLLVGNPIEEKCSADGSWRPEMTKRFTQIKRLDGKTVVRDDVAEEEGK